MTNENQSDKRLLLLHESDNVLVTTATILSGEKIQVEGHSVLFTNDIEVGHKVARSDITATTKIIKYGASIGSSIVAIPLGEHVHTHNMKSDYIPSHTRVGKTG
ncbi:MAG: UxaA family hydrolase [Glaciecola sp.]